MSFLQGLLLVAHPHNTSPSRHPPQLAPTSLFSLSSLSSSWWTAAESRLLQTQPQSIGQPTAPLSDVMKPTEPPFPQKPETRSWGNPPGTNPTYCQECGPNSHCGCTGTEWFAAMAIFPKHPHRISTGKPPSWWDTTHPPLPTASCWGQLQFWIEPLSSKLVPQPKVCVEVRLIISSQHLPTSCIAQALSPPERRRSCHKSQPE